MNHSIGGVIVPETVESWTCEIETDLNQFSENLEADTVTVWKTSRIGHRAPGFNPFKSEMAAGGMFIGDGLRALVSISARLYRRGWLSIVIDRYAPEKEDSGDLAPWGIAPWAEVGQTVTAWLRGWILEHYKVEPVLQRAGLPSWDDYNETGDQERAKTPTGETPEDIQAALAPLRDRPDYWPEVERLVRDYWAKRGKQALPITGKATWTVEKITGYNRSHIYRKTGLGDKEI